MNALGQSGTEWHSCGRVRGLIRPSAREARIIRTRRPPGVVVPRGGLRVGRASNTGQACLAPDCLLVEATVRDAFRPRLVEALRSAAAALAGRTVDRRHFDRLAGLLRDSGGEVVGGAVDEAALRMGPAVVIDLAPDSRLMRDEIFGPILPILTVASIDEEVRFVRQRPDPWRSMCSPESAATAYAVVAATTSGTAAVNHLLRQLPVPDLPFGVGPSGMGAHYGRVGFDTSCRVLKPGRSRPGAWPIESRRGLHGRGAGQRPAMTLVSRNDSRARS
jgi:aldehyde dehydrogenase (NAD+)